MHPSVRLIIGVMMFLLFGRFLFICLHVHPHADDWIYSAAALKDPSIGRILKDYHSWNGRWASNFLTFRNPLILGLHHGIFLYRVTSAAMLLAMVGALYALMVRLVNDRCRSLAIAAGLMLTYLQIMPDLYEGIYWYTGAVTYHLPNILLVFSLVLWIDHQRKPRSGLLVLNGVLTLIIAGSSEVHMVLMLITYSIWSFVTIKRRSPIRVPLIFFAIACTAAAVMIFAPGNAIRGINFPQQHQLFHSLFHGALQTARFLVTWIFHPVTIAASILWVAFDREHRIFDRITIHPLLLSIALLFVIFVIMVMPYWATGVLGQHRTVNVACFLFIMGWPLILSSFDRITERRYFPRITSIGSWMIALWTVTCLFIGTGLKIDRDLLNGKFGAYDRHMHKRYSIITDRILDNEPIEIPPLTAIPRSLHIFDPGTDPGNWPNRGLVEYLRITQDRR